MALAKPFLFRPRKVRTGFIVTLLLTSALMLREDAQMGFVWILGLGGYFIPFLFSLWSPLRRRGTRQL